MTRRLQGGRILAEMLKLHDAGPMFGMGGFQLLPFYGAMRELGLEHHLVNDERSGAFAADAYARVTGRVGICDATLGPGATNLVTGLVESFNAGIPLLAVIGGADRTHAGKHLTQEADQAGILRPAVKQLIRAESAHRLPELVRRAFAVATAGRPGPVVLDIPEDVCHAVVEVPSEEFWADPLATRVATRPTRPDADAVCDAAKLLAAAERPLILAGGGVHLANGHRALREFAEGQRVPVAHTISGKGALACTHPLSVGVFGRYSRTANDLIERADLLLAVGTKLGEIATKRFSLLPRDTPLIQIDVAPEEIGRTVRPRVGLVGDARLALADLLAASSPDTAARHPWVDEVTTSVQGWRARARDQLTSSERPITVGRLVNELNAVLPREAILVADGGFASHWTALLYDTKVAGRGYVANRGFASIGYGLPGAIGAALAAGDGAPVIGVTGDGGLNMSLGELETAIRIGAPLVIVVVNNAASGYVKALQHVLLKGAYQSSELTEIDYGAVARALGCDGVRVEEPGSLAGALRGALASDAPFVVDVAVTRDAGKMLPGLDSRVATAIDRPETVAR